MKNMFSCVFTQVEVYFLGDFPRVADKCSKPDSKFTKCYFIILCG